MGQVEQLSNLKQDFVLQTAAMSVETRLPGAGGTF